MAVRTEEPVGREGGKNSPGPVGGSRRRYVKIHLSEFVVGCLVLALATLAWAALGLAHLEAFSLPAVLAVWVVACVAVTLLIRRLAPVRVALDRGGCAGVVVLGLLAAMMFLPGFAYGVTDKD